MYITYNINKMKNHSSIDIVFSAVMAVCIGIAILFIISLSSCSHSEKITVYDLKPFEPCSPCKIVTAVKGDGVGLAVVVGDTVNVNLEDSEIAYTLRETRYLGSGVYNYVVDRIYEIDKQ
jgi:hypothetical protein